MVMPAAPLRVLAIQNYGPSGSMLLHSLLDGHPEVLSLPGLYPIGIYSGWRTFVADMKRPPTRDEAVGFLMRWLRPLYDLEQLEASWGLTELGDERNAHCCADEEVLRRGLADALAAEPTVSRRAAVTAAFTAYAGCLGRDISRVTTLVYPAHSSEIQDLRELWEDFPDIRFLHTIRDPVDGLFSTVRHHRDWLQRFGGPATDPFTSAIEQMTTDRTPLVEREEPFYALRPFDPALASRSRAIRLEDLHAAPAIVMRAVTDWIGVAWDAALLQSTFAGKKWWNRPGLRRLSGFSEGMTVAAGVTSFDHRRIAAVTAPVRRHYGYAPATSGIGDRLLLLAVIAPFSVERMGLTLRRYVAARRAMARGLLALRRAADWVELLPIPRDGVAQAVVERH